MTTRRCLSCLRPIQLSDVGSFRRCRSEQSQATCLSVRTAAEKRKYLYEDRAVFCLQCYASNTCAVCNVFHCPGCAAYQRQQGRLEFSLEEVKENPHEVMVHCEHCSAQVCKSKHCTSTCTNCDKTICSRCILQNGYVFASCVVCDAYVHNPPVFCLQPPLLCQECHTFGRLCAHCQTVVPEPENKLIDLLLALASIPFKIPETLHTEICWMAFGTRFMIPPFPTLENSRERFQTRLTAIMAHAKTKEMRDMPVTAQFYPLEFRRARGTPWLEANNPGGEWMEALNNFHVATVEPISDAVQAFRKLDHSVVKNIEPIATAIEHGMMVDIPKVFPFFHIPEPSISLWSRIRDMLALMNLSPESSTCLSPRTVLQVVRCIIRGSPPINNALFHAAQSAPGLSFIMRDPSDWTCHERYVFVILRLYVALRRADIVF